MVHDTAPTPSMSECWAAPDAALSYALLEVEYLKLQVTTMYPAEPLSPGYGDLSPLGR